MAFMQRIAIRYKLMLIIMMTCITALLLAGVMQILYGRTKHYEQAVRNISCYAEIIGDNCKASLAFDDAVDAKETLHSLRAEPSIVFACLYDRHNEVLAKYESREEPNEFTIPECRADEYRFEQNYLKVFRQISDDNSLLGTLYLQLDLSRTKAEILAAMRTGVCAILIALFMAYLISSRLQKIISSPILSLAGVAKVVSEKKDYSQRAVKTSNDEFGVFVDAFNEMLEQIQNRNLELVDAKTHLETKVSERTAELSCTNAKLKEEVAQRTAAEESLKNMNDKLAQSNRQLQEFTYIASHDLREPTRKITAFGQLLEESLSGKLDDDDQENLEFMIDGANRMQQMIEALLEYSRVTTKVVQFESVNVNEIMEQLRGIELAVMIEETKAVLSVPKMLPVVKGDPRQIRQLLQNLVSNAMKYQKKGTVPEITVIARRQNNGIVRFEVQDNGIGIKHEQSENVFVMFRRLHSRSEYEGTGIGLAVCRKIVERHAGQIGVDSVYGQGSIFWFTLPALEDQSEPVTDISKPVSEARMGA